MNIFTQIAEAVKKLFSKEIRDKVGVDIAVSRIMAEKIKLWSDCYENKAEWLTDKYRGRHLPSAIAKEMARLVTLEFKSELTGGKRAEYLSEAYNKLIADAPLYTEYACAKGGVMLKPYLSGGYISSAYVQADSFFPTAFDGCGNITGCIFTERKVVGKKFYTRLETHDYSKNLYTVKNAAYLSDSAEMLGRQVSLTAVPEWAELADKVELKNFSRPLFCYFKMPGANQFDSCSPLGVSVFANAVDAIRDADEQYARLLWEFEGSELAVTVSAIQKALRKSLEEYLICLENLCDFYKLAPKDKIEQSFEFDDSLITDSETDQRIWLQEVAAGLMKPEEYRMRRYGETKQQALAALPKAVGDDE